MEINTNFKIKVSPFNDYRDWFLLKKDKEWGVHRTLLKVFIGDMLVGQIEIPINFCEIKCNTVISASKTFSFDYIRMTIEEMNIFRKKDMNNVRIHNGDTLTLDYVFTMGY